MRLNVRLDEISDGKLYDLKDMVKADTQGCIGCSACCHGMGDTIVLTPFDMYQIVTGLNQTYKELMNQKIELHVEEKLTLPNLKMVGESEACAFLDENERCSIHRYRPGICRLFPLGRYYEDDDFKYFMKTGECVKPKLSKIKVKKWVDISDYQENKEFILYWHHFLKALKWRVRFIYDDQELQDVNEYLIDCFYNVDWSKQKAFYPWFYETLNIAKDKLGILLPQ